MAFLFFYAILFLVACYFTGMLITAFTNSNAKNYFLDALQNIFFGSIIIAVLYAIVVTKLMTVLIITIPLLVWLIADKTGQRPIGKKSFNVKGLLYASGITILVLTTSFYCYQYFNTGITGIGFTDNAYYAEAANMLNRYHIEGLNYNVLEPQVPSAIRVPYHYYDLWLVAFIQIVFPVSILESYNFIFMPFALTIIFLSVAAVSYEINKKSTALIILLGILLLFIEFYPLPLNHNIFKYYFFKHPKRFVSFAVFAIFICRFRRNETIKAFLILLLAPVLNILTAPTALTASFIAGYYYYTQRKKEGIAIVITSVLVGTAIVLFYISGGNGAGHGNINLSSMINIRTILILTATSTLFVLVWLFRKRLYHFDIPERKVAAMSMLIVITGVYGILPLNKNNFQLLGFPIQSVTAIMSVAVIVYLFNIIKNKFVQYAGYTLISILLVYNVYKTINRLSNGIQKNSTAFLQDVKNELPENAIIAFVYNEGVLKYQWTYEPHLCNQLFFPYALRKNAKMVSISLPQNTDSLIASLTPPERVDYERGIFYKFIKEHQKKGQSLNIYQQQFLEYHHIKYLVLDRGLDTNTFFKGLSKKQYTDPVSRFSFLVLK